MVLQAAGKQSNNYAGRSASESSYRAGGDSLAALTSIR